MNTQTGLRWSSVAWLLLAAALVGLACSELLAGDGTTITTIDAGPHHRLLGVVALATGADGQAEFEWSADGDVIARRTQHQVTRYFVYSSTSGLDGFGQPVQAAGTMGASFVHTNAPSSPLLYQVRASRLIQTGAGSYWDLGQASFAAVN